MIREGKIYAAYKYIENNMFLTSNYENITDMGPKIDSVSHLCVFVLTIGSHKDFSPTLSQSSKKKVVCYVKYSVWSSI